MLAILFMASALAQSPGSMSISPRHADTDANKGLHLDASSGLEASTPLLRQAGTNVVVQVLWPPRKSDHKARAFALLEVMEREIARDDLLVLAREPSEAEAAVRADQIAVLLSMEGAHGLGSGSDWSQVFDQFYERGLRLMGITWSFSNRFAGSSGDGGRGLTDEGRALVAQARAKRVILDVSHASRQTTMEICRDSPQPVIASHSNAHVLRGHARNLTDEEVRCIAQTGGVIGLNFHAKFVGAPGNANVSRVADHADYLAKIGGHEVVALGSDFDGYIKKPTVSRMLPRFRRCGLSLPGGAGLRTNFGAFAVRISCAHGGALGPATKPSA